MVTQAKQVNETLPLSELPDERGHFGPYGGRFVAETLMGPLEELDLTYRKIQWTYKGGGGNANISGTWNLQTHASS